VKTFCQVLESIEALSPDEQENLVSIVQQRLRDKGRATLVRTVKAARKEFASGRCRPASTDAIMRKIIA
jgi:hypothetical protein